MCRILILVVAFTAIAASASARHVQDDQVPIPPTPAAQTPGSPAPLPQVPAAGRQPTPKPAPPPVAVPVVPGEAPLKIRGRDLNVQVEVTIGDQIGATAPEKKVVSLLAADRTMGRVRANAHAQRGDMGFVGTVLNVDARPIVLDNDRILLELTLEYSPLRETQVKQQPTNLNESLSVILQNGKSLMVSQAADPISDRRMTVEVKATIVR